MLGSESALKELGNEPEYPDEITYLVEWAQNLHGRSGVGMGALAPLSFREVEAWARLMDIGGLEPYEIEGLMILDGAMSDTRDKDFDDEVLKNNPPRAWPQRKSVSQSGD